MESNKLDFTRPMRGIQSKQPLPKTEPHGQTCFVSVGYARWKLINLNGEVVGDEWIGQVVENYEPESDGAK